MLSLSVFLCASGRVEEARERQRDPLRLCITVRPLAITIFLLIIKSCMSQGCGGGGRCVGGGRAKTLAKPSDVVPPTPLRAREDAVLVLVFVFVFAVEDERDIVVCHTTYAVINSRSLWMPFSFLRIKNFICGYIVVSTPRTQLKSLNPSFINNLLY